MKKCLLLPALLVGLAHYGSAQNCAPNGITTNPAAPVNNQRPTKRNTFDFTAQSYALKLALTGVTATRINSPYFTTDNTNISHLYDPIDGLREIYPNQGWELIKKDFGYNDQGVANIPGTTNPYLVMYNKFTSTLRIFIARGENNPYNGANVQIQFNQYSPWQTSLLDHNAELKPLDATFNRGPILSSVPAFLNLPLKWFYADFPMVYDPCTCLYQSKVEVLITLSSTSQVTGTTTTTGNLASTGTPTSTQSGNGSFTIGDLAATAKKATQTYKSSYIFERDIKPALKKRDNTADAIKETGLTNLGTAIRSSGFLKAGLGSIPYLGDALSVLDFFIGGGKQAPQPQQVEVMPMSIKMTGTYTGAIAINYPYNTISFRTPGSNVGTAPDSEYPYYNEVLGVLNLLKTPKILHGVSTKFMKYDQWGEPVYRTTETYRVSEKIQYVLNPASGLEVQEISAALIVLGGQFTGPGFANYEGNNVTSGGGIEQFRSSYFNLTCLPQTILTLFTTEGNEYNDIPPSGAMRIKLMVNLRRKNATDNTQNVLLVATYPVIVQEVTSVGTTTTCSGGVQLPELASSVHTFCQAPPYKQTSRGVASYKENLRKMEEDEAAQRRSFESETMPEFEVLPNPVEDQAKILYSVHSTDRVKITLSNSVGQQVATLLDIPNHETGSFETVLNAVPYPKGLYFCTTLPSYF